MGTFFDWRIKSAAAKILLFLINGIGFIFYAMNLVHGKENLSYSSSLNCVIVKAGLGKKSGCIHTDSFPILTLKVGMNISLLREKNIDSV